MSFVVLAAVLLFGIWRGTKIMFKLKRRVIFIVSILFIWAILPVVYAQESMVDSVTINDLAAIPDTEGKVNVSVYASIFSKDEQPMGNLKAADFTIIENGTPVDLTAVSITNDPMVIALVIDTSKSMGTTGTNGKSTIDLTREALELFIQSLNPDDQVAIYSFNKEIKLEKDLDIDHGAAINTLGKIVSQEKEESCLYDATIQAIGKLLELPQKRRSVVVLTDGKDEISIQTIDDVINKAIDSKVKVPLFIIGVGNVDERELTRLARLTGGRSLITKNSVELTNLFTSLTTQLKNQYLLTYPTQQVVSGEYPVVVKVAGDIKGQAERSLFIPAVQVTPTPAKFSMSIVEIKQNSPLQGELEVVIDISKAGKVVNSKLLLNGNLEQQKSTSPFDHFVLSQTDLKPGENNLQVEVINENGIIISDKRSLTLSLPPTPIPAVIPTPAISPFNGFANAKPYLIFAVLVMVIIGLVILVLGVIFFRNRNKSSIKYQPKGSTQGETLDDVFLGNQTTPNPFEVNRTIDEFGGFAPNDPYKTMDDAVEQASAQLIVIEATKVPKRTTYPIDKPKVTIGRNGGNISNDINIPEQSISRTHAEIIYHNKRFTIKDLGSTFGTFVGGKRISKNQSVELQEGTEISLSEKVKLVFELVDPYKTSSP